MLETMYLQSLAPDDEAIVLLCARLNARDRDADRANPLTLLEWNLLARKIASSSFASPGALLGASVADLAAGLALDSVEAERFVALLDRGGMLAVELERLAGRGIGVVTRADRARYPGRMRRKLRDGAPPVLFFAGDLALAKTPGLAVIGSRDIDSTGEEFTAEVARQAVREGLALVSGAARGVDSIAMNAALDSGIAIGCPADSLENTLRPASIRAAVAEGTCLLLTPFHPRAPFSVGAAMGRNKLIYALADYALVVAATRAKGGTWSGAVEALKAGWTPVFVREAPNEPSGNSALRELGGKPFPADLAALDDDLAGFLARRSTRDGESTTSGSPFARGEERPVVESGPTRDSRADDCARTDSAQSALNNSVEVNETARLLAFLEVPRGEDEVAAHLGVGRGLVRGILKEHVVAGRISRLEKPVRYQRPQPNLWES